MEHKYKLGRSSNVDKRVTEYGAKTKVLIKLHKNHVQIYENNLIKMLSEYVYHGREHIKFNDEKQLKSLFMYYVKKNNNNIKFYKKMDKNKKNA